MNNTALAGRNIYTDKKDRTIFYHFFSKKGYIIPEEDTAKFYVYKNRFAVIIISMVIFSDYFSNWFILLPCGIALWLVMELYFYYSFFNKLRVSSSQATLQKKSLLHTIIQSKQKGKTILKTILFFALSVLIVINSYLQDASITTYIITAIISLGSAYYGFMHLYGFFKMITTK